VALTNEAAAQAYDKAAIERGKLDQLNFDDYELPVMASASPAPQHGSSRFQGVSWNTVARKWNAQLRVQGVREYLGSFDDETTAARAYGNAVIKRGTLDQLNFDDYELPEPASAGIAPQGELS
jgi:hypothetical protein